MKRQFFSRYERLNKKQIDSQRLKAKNKKSELLKIYKEVEALRKDGQAINVTSKNIRNNTILSDIKKTKKKVAKNKRIEKKRKALEQWIDPYAITLMSNSLVDKFTWNDINSGNIDKVYTSDVFEKVAFSNPDKIYKLTKAFKLSYVDWSENITLEEALSMFKGKGFTYNLKKLNEINSKRVTGTGKAGTSGGMPGSVAFTYGSQDWLRQFANDRGVQTRRWRKFAKQRQHTNSRLAGWQHLAKRGSTSIKEISVREIVEIANAIMYHVNENGREEFYTEYYDFFVSEIPSLSKVLPNPKFSY